MSFLYSKSIYKDDDKTPLLYTFNILYEARISGNVNGTIFSNDTLIISEEAVVNADINANIILISGNVKGNAVRLRFLLQGTCTVIDFGKGIPFKQDFVFNLI